MNLGAWIQANKQTAAAVGAVGVVGVVLVARNRGGGGETPSSPAGIVGGYSAGGQTDGSTGGGTYDSSASDLYSALSGELGGIASSLQQLNERPSTPVPAPPKPASGLAPGFYRKGASSPIYQVNADGTIDYLTHKEFGAITKGGKKPPKVTAISSDNAVWQNGAHWLDKHKQSPTPPIPTPAPAAS